MSDERRTSASSDEIIETYRESRWRLPVRLAAIGLSLLLFSFLASRAVDVVIAGGIALVALGFLGWAATRALRPVTVAAIDRNGISLRTRAFEAGWQDAWTYRYFPSEQIAAIEIGKRTDYPPHRSYSDTASYEFLLVKTRDGNRYSYAPLQRVERRDALVASLLNHEALRDRVKGT